MSLKLFLSWPRLRCYEVSLLTIINQLVSSLSGIWMRVRLIIRWSINHSTHLHIGDIDHGGIEIHGHGHVYAGLQVAWLDDWCLMGGIITLLVYKFVIGFHLVEIILYIVMQLVYPDSLGCVEELDKASVCTRQFVTFTEIVYLLHVGFKTTQQQLQPLFHILVTSYCAIG